MSDTPEAANVARLVPGKTDAELADQIRADLAEPLKACAEVMNRARAAGLTVGFSINPDQHGRYFVQPISIVRPI